jgi:hypothetical protein
MTQIPPSMVAAIRYRVVVVAESLPGLGTFRALPGTTPRAGRSLRQETT